MPKKFTRDLIQMDVKTDLKRLEEAYSQTRALGKKQYEGRLRLLAVFARQVAASVNASTFYSYQMFARATGLTATDCLACQRIEKVKNLLLDPHQRISEVVHEVAFRSLSQFNRVFRRVTGQVSVEWREMPPAQRR